MNNLTTKEIKYLQDLKTTLEIKKLKAWKSQLF